MRHALTHTTTDLLCCFSATSLPLPQVINYAFSYNISAESIIPYTLERKVEALPCNVPLLRGTKPGQVVQTATEGSYVYPWNNEKAIMRVRVRVRSM